MATAPKKASEFERLAADELDDLTVIVPVVTEDEEGVTADAAMELDELAEALGVGEAPAWSEVTGKPETFPPATHTHAYETLTGKPTLATVATSGAYNDLSGKPTLGTAAVENVGAFAAASHTQAIATITGLIAALAAKLDTSAVGAPNGAASLDGGGVIPSGQLPAIAVTDTFEVASQAAMLALTAEKGDVAIRTDLSKCFILATNSPSTLADWKELRTPTDVVLAVAGLTGTITAAALKAAIALEIDDVDGLQDALDNAGGSGGFETLTSGPTVTLDFSANETAILDVDTDVTFAYSNLSAGKTKTVFVMTSEVSTSNLSYPGTSKNVSNTALPTTISGSTVHKLTFHSTGTTAAEVMIEYANGAGTVFALTAPADISISKGSTDSRTIATVSGGGPNIGYVIVTVAATSGTFTLSSTGFGVYGTPNVDPDGSERWTSVSFLSDKANAATHLSATLTWYPPTSGGTPVVGSGAINCNASAGAIVTYWSFNVTSYGADEVQQLAWSRFGSPTQCADGVFTLYHSGYGTSGAIEAIGGISAVQAALTALMGSAAPTVGGDMTTTTFTYSNGVLAHTDTSELTVAAGSPVPHDGSASVYFSFTKTQTGDGVSVPDQYTGGWDSGSVGRVLFDSVPFIKGSGAAVTIGSITYSLTDMGASFTLTCTSDFADHGTVSAAPYLGFTLDSAFSTTTQGNT